MLPRSGADFYFSLVVSLLEKLGGGGGSVPLSTILGPYITGGVFLRAYFPVQDYLTLFVAPERGISLSHVSYHEHHLTEGRLAHFYDALDFDGSRGAFERHWS